MDDDADDIDDLMRAAFRVPRGRARVDAIRRVIQIMDQRQDMEASFWARERLIGEAYYTGDLEDIFVEFAWLVGQVRKRPELFELESILWEYKWVVEYIHEFPDLSQAQIDSIFDDFKSSMLECGFNLRPYYQFRALYGVVHDERALVEDCVARWHDNPRDGKADCRACEANHEITALAYLGRHEEAIRLAEPILQRRLSCAEIPHRTHATLLRSYMILGDWEAAETANRTGERLLSGNANFVWHLGEHMMYHCVVDAPEAALVLLERNLAMAMTASKQYGRCHFYTAAQMALAAVGDADVDTLQLRLPREFPLYQADATYAVQALHDWFAEQALALATRFDQRHGGQVFRDRLAENLQLPNSLRPRPL